MRQVILVRGPGSDEGTVGSVYVAGQFFGRSIELPDRDNRRMISRIPAGTYRCVWHRSPRFGWCYRVCDVPGRSHILIHPANWGGDASMGYRCDLNGCIGMGTVAGRLRGQRAVLASRTAIGRFNDRMDRKPFNLTILEAAGV